MTSNLASHPAWQTEELAEAWIDEEEYQESVDGSKNSIRRCVVYNRKTFNSSSTGMQVQPWIYK